MKIWNSVKSKYYNYLFDNFAYDKYSKNLKKFKDIHTSESCFIIGNGPSLDISDLEILARNNIPCFAFNRIYLLFNKTSWRPTYYISQDEKTLGNSINEVNSLSLNYKFIPINMKCFFNLHIKNAIYFKLVPGNVKNNFSEDISSFVVNSNTVAFTAAQFAAYMGFKKIYLIGVDHSFSTYQNDKGEIINDNSVKDYFSEEYNRDKANLYIPNLDASTRAFIIMKEYCDNNQIEVYNCTRGGKLEVFPRVDFDKLFKE